MDKKMGDYIKNRYKELIAEKVDPEKAYSQAALEWLQANFKDKKKNEK